MSPTPWGEAYVWLAIGAILLATVATRSLPHLLGAQFRMPAAIDAALRYAPGCALAAIIAPDLIHGGAADALPLLENPRLAGALGAILIHALTRSVVGTIFGGMLVFWLARVAMT